MKFVVCYPPAKATGYAGMCGLAADKPLTEHHYLTQARGVAWHGSVLDRGASLVLTNLVSLRVPTTSVGDEICHGCLVHWSVAPAVWRLGETEAGEVAFRSVCAVVESCQVICSCTWSVRSVTQASVVPSVLPSILADTKYLCQGTGTLTGDGQVSAPSPYSAPTVQTPSVDPFS